MQVVRSSSYYKSSNSEQDGGPLFLINGMVAVLTLGSSVAANDSDRFNYRGTDTSGAYIDYRPSDWSKVTCSDTQTCVSTLTRSEVTGRPLICYTGGARKVAAYCFLDRRSCMEFNSRSDSSRHCVTNAVDRLLQSKSSQHWMRDSNFYFYETILALTP
jgi:hypothetical protein